MPNSIKIRVLVEYDPYLRLLAAFNRGQFHHSNRRDFLRSVLCAFVAIMFLIIIPLYIILIAWFVIENGVEWKKCAVAIPLVAAVLQMSITFIVMIIRNHAVSDVIDGLQQVIDQRCTGSEQIYRIYANAEQKHASLTKILFILCVGFSAFGFSLLLLFPISYAIFGYPPPENWLLFVEMHSLFGRTTYIGFIVDWFIEISLNSACMIILIQSGSIAIGVWLYINAMVTDLKIMLNDDDCLNESERVDAWSTYVRGIRFHNDIIGIAESMFHVMEVTMFNMTVSFTTVIAFNLFVIELSDGMNFGRLVAFMDLCLLFGMTFTFFHVLEWITMDLMAIGDVFYNSPWYDRLRPKQQKLLALTIQRTQREARVTALGLFDCSLVLFPAIIRSASSYYLMIREFR